MRYAVIFENLRADTALVPDLPGCIAAGDSLDEARQLIRGAIELHLADMRATGQSIPQPISMCEYAEIDMH